MKYAKYGVIGVICAVITVWATAASSSDPQLRDVNDRPITPGTEVAQLVRGADGRCHGSYELAGKIPADQAAHGSVTLDVDEATCKVVVAKVMTADAPQELPTEHVSGGGVRQP